TIVPTEAMFGRLTGPMEGSAIGCLDASEGKEVAVATRPIMSPLSTGCAPPPSASPVSPANARIRGMTGTPQTTSSRPAEGVGPQASEGTSTAVRLLLYSD